MMKKCYVLNGKIINIGEWDYQKYTDEEGNEVIGNPLPEGVTIEKRDFEYDEGRGWYEVGVPQLLSDKERIQMLEDTILFLMDLQMGGDL